MARKFRKTSKKSVLIIGGGIAGLSAAIELARIDLDVAIIEKSDHLGGHAAQLTCKATEKCVKCEACKVVEKIRLAQAHENIIPHLDSTLTRVDDGEILTAFYHEKNGVTSSSQADAIIIATGFQPYNPETKPYGYHRFENVITSLELEKMVKETDELKRPSDGNPPEKIAFIQCVGSRDASLNHLWCSKICCPSSLRMAHLIQFKHPDSEITFFYIDFQNCGKNFQKFQSNLYQNIRTVRAIPGDIFKTSDDRLNVSYFDPEQGKSSDEPFDMVVLSVGLAPNRDNTAVSEILGMDLADTGFMNAHGKTGMAKVKGLFAAGTALGPMGIEEAFSSGTKTAHSVMRYLRNETR